MSKWLSPAAIGFCLIFAHQLPAGIGGVILAVLLCDAMQTLVSGVNSISAVFTTDVFRKRDADASTRLVP